MKNNFFLVKYNNDVFARFPSVVETKREDDFVLRIVITPLFISTHSTDRENDKMSNFKISFSDRR